MGEEIANSHFCADDYVEYKRRLLAEMQLLRQWFDQAHFADEPLVAGFEIEAWLIDSQLEPAPINERFLQTLNDPLAGPELASFNIEVNTIPRQLQGHIFSSLHQEMTATWKHCCAVAAQLDSDLVMTGILPTVTNEALNLGNMSQMKRYRALNREVMHRRHGKPLTLDINGMQHLKVTHRNVMLESAATSFQIHIQVPPSLAAYYYNTCIIMSAPMVALSANSPFLFAKDLWDETRIPLFEQAVAVGGYDGAAFGPIRRVSFGSGYVRESLRECFEENLDHYPILLPVKLQQAAELMPHVRLHNGTIWRWNRPLIGFDEAGQPHLRIEHRVVPAGPSIVDTIANAVFFYGLLQYLIYHDKTFYQSIDFDKARDNFYAAARHGMRAQLYWGNKGYRAAQELLMEMLPMVREGLQLLDIAITDIDDYLQILQERISSQMNGAAWQRAYVKKHGNDMRALLAAYREHSRTDQPVASWTI